MRALPQRGYEAIMSVSARAAAIFSAAAAAAAAARSAAAQAAPSNDFLGDLTCKFP